MNPTDKEALVESMALAIRDYEGGPGSLNYQLNNPGNFRPSPAGYKAKYGNVRVIDTDTNPSYLYHKGKFACFPTYELGFEYLENHIRNKARQNPNWRLLEFFETYSPTGDNNNPIHYAIFVARRMGVSTSFVMGDLV